MYDEEDNQYLDCVNNVTHGMYVHLMLLLNLWNVCFGEGLEITFSEISVLKKWNKTILFGKF